MAVVDTVRHTWARNTLFLNWILVHYTSVSLLEKYIMIKIWLPVVVFCNLYLGTIYCSVSLKQKQTLTLGFSLAFWRQKFLTKWKYWKIRRCVPFRRIKSSKTQSMKSGKLSLLPTLVIKKQQHASLKFSKCNENTTSEVSIV